MGDLAFIRLVEPQPGTRAWRSIAHTMMFAVGYTMSPYATFTSPLLPIDMHPLTSHSWIDSFWTFPNAGKVQVRRVGSLMNCRER